MTPAADPITYDEVLHALLWVVAVETGDVGVWEPLWEMNGQLGQAMQAGGLEPTVELCRQVILDMSARGWVEFFWRSWPPTGDATTLPKVSHDEAAAELAKDGWLYAPPETDLWIFGTDEGEQVANEWMKARADAGLWMPLPPAPEDAPQVNLCKVWEETL